MQEKNDIKIEDIIKLQKQNNSKSDSELIKKAYEFAIKYHGDQRRKSGELYIVHPLNVAYILSGLELDDESVCAALLHDVVEDTPATNEDLINEFGESIAAMVAGVTKLGKIQYTTIEEEQVENYRKMFLAMR